MQGVAMKKISTALFLGGVLAISAANPALSYEESRFLGIDRDANGSISMEEAQAYRARLFKEYDLNSDGKVEYEEYVEAEGLRSVTATPYSKVPVPDEYREMDSDGDTVVTMEEITTAGAARFKSLDKNADGQVSKDEFVSPGL
jgi:Ca2+-binding EF-hand superfamily protein